MDFFQFFEKCLTFEFFLLCKIKKIDLKNQPFLTWRKCLFCVIIIPKNYSQISQKHNQVSFLLISNEFIDFSEFR